MHLHLLSSIGRHSEDMDWRVATGWAYHWSIDHAPRL